jgi:hypothetical protein
MAALAFEVARGGDFGGRGSFLEVGIYTDADRPMFA